MPYESLNKARLTRALRRLGDLAHAKGLVLELSMYGGAVFTLVYGSREATRDVDGLIRPAAAAAGAAAVRVGVNACCFAVAEASTITAFTRMPSCSAVSDIAAAPVTCPSTVTFASLTLWRMTLIVKNNRIEVRQN